MKILLTNDDGIHAEGLWALERALSKDHNVCVVAPDKERSAIGHSITLLNPLRVNRIETNGGCGYAVTGTPADCVKLAIVEILDGAPDLVVSGINPGANVGINLNYSGTVSAAKEGALLGVPGLAVSKDPPFAGEYDFAARFVRHLVKKISENRLAPYTFLNVNFPGCPSKEIRGVRITRQGTAPLISQQGGFHKRLDPRNQVYYWQGMERQAFETQTDSDGAALEEKWISITPVKCDMTDHDAIQALATWKIELS
jgi:5'-nucleotidase